MGSATRAESRSSLKITILTVKPLTKKIQSSWQQQIHEKKYWNGSKQIQTCSQGMLLLPCVCAWAELFQCIAMEKLCVPGQKYCNGQIVSVPGQKYSIGKILKKK